MIVISDTSPVHYLCLIDQLHLLPTLFGEVVVPAAVIAELTDPSAPQKVRDAMATLPAWMKVVHGVPVGDTPGRLGQGEREAIALASRSIGEVLLIVDDADARRAAIAMRLRVIGTIGIPRDASLAGLARFSECVAKLRLTSMRLPPDAVLDELIGRLG